MRIKIKMPIFLSPLVVWVGDKEGFSKEVSKWFDDIEEKEAWPNGRGKCAGSFVFIHKPDLDTLSHELHHYADNLADHLGIEDKNKEFEAYILGYCLKRIWGKIEGAQ